MNIKNALQSVKFSISRIGSLIAGLIPQPLPVGMTAFNAWVNHMIQVYRLTDIMTARDASYTLAAAILGADQKVAYRSNFHFYLVLRAAAAKQIAGAKFQEIQQAAQAERKAAMEAAKASEPPTVQLVNPQN